MTTPPADRRGFDRFAPNFRGRSFPGAIYVAPYDWDYFTNQYPIDQYPTTPSYPYPGPEAEPVQEEAPPPVGYVSLQLQTGVNPQVYVDGSYVGTLDALGGELTLEAGRHTVELWAEGYEPAVVDVDVPVYRTISYQGVLRPASGSPQGAVPDQTSPNPMTIYFVPGCYVGNVPPRDSDLPAGCDGKRMIRFSPRP